MAKLQSCSTKCCNIWKLGTAHFSTVTEWILNQGKNFCIRLWPKRNYVNGTNNYLYWGYCMQKGWLSCHYRSQRSWLSIYLQVHIINYILVNVITIMLVTSITHQFEIKLPMSILRSVLIVTTLSMQNGFTLLMYACKAGREEMVKMLLSQTKKPNCLTRNKVCLIWI